jgi:hypothetical protein
LIVAAEIHPFPFRRRPTAIRPVGVVTVTMTSQKWGADTGPPDGATYTGPPDGGHVSSAEGGATRTETIGWRDRLMVNSATATAFLQSSGASGPQSTAIPRIVDGEALETTVGTTVTGDGLDVQAASSGRTASRSRRCAELTCVRLLLQSAFANVMR